MRLRSLLLPGLLVFSVCPRTANAQFMLPPGNDLLLDTFGDGVQIYKSQLRTDGSNTYQWVFIAPSATLYTDSTETVPVATHFAGPTWMLDSDGSSVVGLRIDSAPSSHPNSIPQLELSAKSYGGNGLFNEVTYIERLNTVDGLAPLTDPTGANQEFDSHYTATYRFFDAAVPEPGTLALLTGLMVSGAAFALGRRKAGRSRSDQHRL